MLESRGSITATVNARESINGAVDFRRSVAGGVTVNIPELYGGEYEVTPSSEMQIIPISGKQAARNMTIYPIPSNYGLIEWDGSVLTVT